ncbi:MAG TPA: heme peroxidase family protein [Pyrinomonadaceae bacterium]|jgi:hypothetical protein
MATHDNTATALLAAEEGHAHAAPVPATLAATAVFPSFKFDRMFPDIKDTTQGADAEQKVRALIALGTVMDAVSPPGHANGNHSEDSLIPAGYTYLGQFIAHEITFDGKMEEVFTTEVNPADVPQCCSPTLDLDSLYGGKPDKENGRLYQADNVRMKVGETSNRSHWPRTPPLDLPRTLVEGNPVPQATIGDRRNDENLPTAQTHVAFINFHNKVADWLDAENAKKSLPRASFEEVRELVIRHFQWIVLNDYLPHIVNEVVLRQVISDMRSNGGQARFFTPRDGGGLYMPVEFSVGAFRFGHSMVRSFYDWNYFHKTKTHLGAASLRELFRQTGFSGDLGLLDKLSSEWIIDWKRFYDFSTSATRPNFAKKIDTTFDFRLGDIKGFRHPQQGGHSEEMLKSFRPLPVRNLLRGFALRLPSGQDIAEVLGLSGTLLADDIAQGSHEAVLREHGFHENTPLWYYVLKEAATLGEGNRLGPVGSRLVAETFVGIIRNSEFSILDPADETKDWRPILGQRAPHAFDMTDMLEFTGIVTPMVLS